MTPAEARTTSTFKIGDQVRVRFGLDYQRAVVTDIRNGSVWVDIHIEGTDEPIPNFYRPEDVSPAA